MQNTYTQKQKTAQKKEAPTAATVLDSSSQSEALQRKADMANNTIQREEAPRPNNTGMPDNLKSGIESLSGFSMDDVRVHYNSSKPATVQALAYTQGTDIHVAPGQEKHLPHEAWHVAQQMAGRVSPTTNINGMPVNDNAGLEHEADVMGGKATSQSIVPSNAVQLYPVVRGGTITPENFTNGSGVISATTNRKTPSTTEPLKGVSTICKTKNLSENDADDENEICATIYHTKYGLSSDTKVTEKNGTFSSPTPWRGDIVHQEINGLTANQLVEIFSPTKDNPSPRRRKKSHTTK